MKTRIITIGRSFGSGGRLVGRLLAEQLGMAYYDKELIRLASRESGICGEFFEKADERSSGGLLKALAMGFTLSSPVFQCEDYLSDESLFQIQSDVIRKLGVQGNCVLVGRCADYILRDRSDCFRIFISASLEDRMARTLEYTGMERSRAAEFLAKADKSRASYYNYFTDKEWGAAASYDLCVSSSCFGIEGTAALIRGLLP